MEFTKDISKFITQICEKNYSSANSTLENLIEKKLKKRIKKMHKDCCNACAKKKKKVVIENIGRLAGIADGGEPYEDDELDRINSDHNQPEEGDYIISNHGRLGGRTLVSIVGGKNLGTYTEEDDARKAIKNHMISHGESPVWFNDDHGGYTQIKNL